MTNIILDRVEFAKSLFQGGFNCAQSVFTAFHDAMAVDRETALRIASGLGAGMGGLQNTCGAVLGAFMVIGYFNGKYRADDSASKERAYSLVRRFADEFSHLNTSINCLTLMDCDLATEEGEEIARSRGYFETRCLKYVEDAVRLLQSKYVHLNQE